MNIENKKLTELLSKIGTSMYAYSEELPEDEKWNICAKLRNRSSDAISWAAEASGSIDPRDIKWALGKSRASLAVVKATYKHACNVGLLTLNPEIMVWSEQAMKEIDLLIKNATADIPSWFVEMDPPAPTKDIKR